MSTDKWGAEKRQNASAESLLVNFTRQILLAVLQSDAEDQRKESSNPGTSEITAQITLAVPTRPYVHMQTES